MATLTRRNWIRGKISAFGYMRGILDGLHVPHE